MKTVGKIIARTVLILIAALVVVGATFAVSSSGALNGELMSRRPGREGFISREGANAQGQAPAPDSDAESSRRGAGRRAGRGELPEGFEGGRQGGFSAFGFQEVIRNLTTVLVIVGAVVVLALAWRLFRRTIRKRTGPPPPSRPIQA